VVVDFIALNICIAILQSKSRGKLSYCLKFGSSLNPVIILSNILYTVEIFCRVVLDEPSI